MIKFVKHKDIDKQKWDKLILESPNGFIYATSFHLDLVSGDWNALILDDYDAVMPLPENKKIGVRYAMQPKFSQQLGVISKTDEPDFCIKDFIVELHRNYKYFALNLNYKNKACVSVNTIEYVNQVLNLNTSYEEIRALYSKNTRRNIDRIDSKDFDIKTNAISTDEFISVFKNNLPDKSLEKYIDTAEKLLKYYSNNECGKVLSLHEKSTGNLLACVQILTFNHRHIYLLPVSNTEGKNKKSMFFLIDNFIQENSNTDFLLDFEGSNFDGVQRFYSGFGAVKQNYINIYNKPFFVK